MRISDNDTLECTWKHTLKIDDPEQTPRITSRNRQIVQTWWEGVTQVCLKSRRSTKLRFIKI